MKNRKRTALILVPVFLVGLTGGIAWSQQGEGRQGRGGRARGGGARAPAWPAPRTARSEADGAGTDVKAGADAAAMRDRSSA